MARSKAVFARKRRSVPSSMRESRCSGDQLMTEVIFAPVEELYVAKECERHRPAGHGPACRPLR